MVIDSLKLNDKTIDDKYPIPDITEILDKLGNSKYFNALDIKYSFFHRYRILRIQKNAFWAQKRTLYISTTDELRFMRLSK